ncbi:hypothetical protein [Nocardioides koreensis]|uniref:hypothetical protein n=1 Tax=Nocardioides koreensis TaxID=433651 RepID=UPI0031DA2800
MSDAAGPERWDGARAALQPWLDSLDFAAEKELLRQRSIARAACGECVDLEMQVSMWVAGPGGDARCHGAPSPAGARNITWYFVQPSSGV